VEHRLEHVLKIIALILASYNPNRRRIHAFQCKIRGIDIICLGVDNSKLFEAFGNMVDIIVETQYMSEAVKLAYKVAEAGDNVLLSPACASFDLFENYEDRGRQFKNAVRNL
jgi:UDP-N-acetylmuramoylalanine-D-glutamate ligase